MIVVTAVSLANLIISKSDSKEVMNETKLKTHSIVGEYGKVV